MIKIRKNEICISKIQEISEDLPANKAVLQANLRNAVT
jgi:hypothetical protein